MKRYSIVEYDGELVVKVVIDGEVRVITSPKEISDLVVHFISNGYVVKRHENFMSLDCNGTALRIHNFKALENDPYLAKLKNDISVTIKRCGYVDKRKANDISRKVNREKSKNYKGAAVVTGAVAALCVGILAFTLNTQKPALVASEEVDELVDNILIVEDEQEKSIIEEAIASEPLEDNLMYFLEDEEFFKELEEARAQEEKKDEPQEQVSVEGIETLGSSNVESRSESVFETRGYLPIPDYHNEEKALVARSLYYTYMEKNARDFGLDAELLLAMGTQERGVHSPVKDSGGGLGLMQIQYDVWIDKTINCYKLNPNTGEFEPYSIYVTDEKLQSLEGNIEVGSAILQTCMRTAKYNIPLAIQMYNQGSGSMEDIVWSYCEATGKDYKTVKADPTDIGWTDYCYLKPGDSEYLINVNKWVLNRNYTVTNLKTCEPVSYSFIDNSTNLEVEKNI